jgi:hypothetical protein
VVAVFLSTEPARWERVADPVGVLAVESAILPPDGSQWMDGNKLQPGTAEDTTDDADGFR